MKEYSNNKLVILGIGDEQKDIVETMVRLNIRKNIMYSFDFVPDPERARYMEFKALYRAMDYKSNML